METILKFNDEEENKVLLALHGKDFALVLWDIDNQLRRWIRGKDKKPFDNVEECLDKVQELLYDSMERYGVSLDIIG